MGWRGFVGAGARCVRSASGRAPPAICPCEGCHARRRRDAWSARAVRRRNARRRRRTRGRTHRGRWARNPSPSAPSWRPQHGAPSFQARLEVRPTVSSASDHPPNEGGGALHADIKFRLNPIRNRRSAKDSPHPLTGISRCRQHEKLRSRPPRDSQRFAESRHRLSSLPAATRPATRMRLASLVAAVAAAPRLSTRTSRAPRDRVGGVRARTHRPRVRGRAFASAARDDPGPFPRSWPAPMGEIVSDKVAYKRYLTVFDREVEFAAKDAPGHAPHRVAYDIVGHPKSNFQFTVVFPFPSATAGAEPQVTLIREYIQASNAMGYSLPTGSFDPAKHANLEDAAVNELAEEARLEGGAMTPPPRRPLAPRLHRVQVVREQVQTVRVRGPDTSRRAPGEGPGRIFHRGGTGGDRSVARADVRRVDDAPVHNHRADGAQRARPGRIVAAMMRRARGRRDDKKERVQRVRVVGSTLGVGFSFVENARRRTRPAPRLPVPRVSSHAEDELDNLPPRAPPGL